MVYTGTRIQPRHAIMIGGSIASWIVDYIYRLHARLCKEECFRLKLKQGTLLVCLFVCMYVSIHIYCTCISNIWYNCTTAYMHVYTCRFGKNHGYRCNYVQ